MEEEAEVTIPPVRITVIPGISFRASARSMPFVITVSSVKTGQFHAKCIGSGAGIQKRCTCDLLPCGWHLQQLPLFFFFLFSSARS